MTDEPPPVGPQPTMPVHAVRKLVFDANTTVQARFAAELPAEIDRAVQGIAAAHLALDRFRAGVAGSQQTATLELFFHSAVHSVLCSVHHLVSGYPIAAGNMMRHYTESVAMALLCIDPGLGVLDAFSRAPSRYAVHKAPTMLRQRRVKAALQQSVAFDSAAWEAVLQIAELYDELSHASALSLGHQQLFSTENMMILGGEYDPAKREPYRSDLVRTASAAEALAHLIDACTAALPARESA